jgi:hypothetical protein
VTEPDLETAFDRAFDLARSLELGVTEQEQQLGRAILEVRRHILTREGKPDWLGTTGAYRSRVQEIFGAIDADDVAIKRLMQRLRTFYHRELPKLMNESDVVGAADAVESMIPMDDDFFEAINVYTAEYGRDAANSAEALQLLIAASRLLGFVQVDAIVAEGSPAPALVSQTIQSSIEIKARVLRDQLDAS